MNELTNRGVEDGLIAVVDGLKGFPDSITAVLRGIVVLLGGRSHTSGRTTSLGAAQRKTFLEAVVTSIHGC